jgi:copper chaperone CopZ
MKYQIDISGMHCSGCKNLITMSLEDIGFKDVIVDPEKNTAQFISSKNTDDVEKDLQEVFKELTDYRYSNINIIA